MLVYITFGDQSQITKLELLPDVLQSDSVQHNKFDIISLIPIIDPSTPVYVCNVSCNPKFLSFKYLCT